MSPWRRARTASGDTLYHYVALACVFGLAIVIAAIWSLMGRRRLDYARLHDRLRIYLRYALALILIFYGLVKVFKTQFPFPEPDRLIQPIGESSPMGLMWTFLGYSTAYNVFIGATEIGAGALLFSRRTTTLGALAAAAIMTQIVVLNFTYDVPVKLFSLHLLLISTFLLLPDASRLANVFLLGRRAEPPPPRPPFRARWLEGARPALKLALLGGAVAALVHDQLGTWLERGDHAPAHPLYGLYEVERFAIDGEERPPLLTDSTRWHLFAVQSGGEAATVRKADGSSRDYRMRTGHAEPEITLNPEDGGDGRLELDYRLEDGELELAGAREGSPVRILLRERDLSELPLLRRGFHWIQPRPFNR